MSSSWPMYSRGCAPSALNKGASSWTSHTVSAPQRAWDAISKKTGVTLDLITDPAMYQMIENGMSVGNCMIRKLYGKANKELVGDYNPEPTTYISDCDANNLYGWAMSQFLPWGNFYWVGPEGWQPIQWQ